MAFEAKYGQLDIPGIPEHEPVFVLRAQDVCAPEAIEHYRQLCGQAGSPQAHLDGIADARLNFVVWQNDHPVHVPDSSRPRG